MIIFDIVVGCFDWIIHREEPLKVYIKARIIERKLKKYI